jgi:hypothetical protein
VLLGIADMSRKSIHVAHALPEPKDSRGSRHRSPIFISEIRHSVSA